MQWKVEMAATSLPSLSPPTVSHHQLQIYSSAPSLALRFSATPLPSELPSLSHSLKTSSFSICLLRSDGAYKRPLVFQVSADLNKAHRPLKVMISGAPASGKGTQCELIVKYHDLVHISAGDLLRAEVAAGTEMGKKAKEYMTRGELVPNEIVVNMVKQRLNQPDAQQRGWLLDGYPRSKSQAEAIEAAGLIPDVFILLEVPEDILIDRVVGRRLDPVTGKIYHLKYAPPETTEIADRLTQRFDDTEEQARMRLRTHSQNVDAVLATYSNVLKRIDGNRPKEEVFKSINETLSEYLDESAKVAVGSA